MDGASVTKLAVLSVLIVGSGFFSSTESALFALGRFRLRRLKGPYPKNYEAAQRLLREPGKLIATLVAGNELVNCAIGVVGASLVYDLAAAHISEDLLPLLAIVLVLPFLLIFGEIVPKTFGLKYPDLVAGVNSLPLLWVSRFMAPLSDGLAAVSRFVLRLTGRTAVGSDQISEEIFRTFVDAGTEEGILDVYETKMIHNVFNLDDIRVADIMTPASQVVFMVESMRVSDAARVIRDQRYSRYPVFDEEQKRVVGTLYAKDLLTAEKSQLNSSIHPYIRPPLLVPMETTAMHLFAEFRQKRTHFAVVCAAFAHETLGVVTLDDVLKKIFGTIRDERDMEEGLSTR